MATETEKLLLQIDAQTTLLRQELAKARGEIDGFANTTERRLGGIDGAFARISGGAGTMVRSLGGIAAGFVGVAQAASLAVNSTREMQRLNAQLEVATGSASAAASAFDGLAKFAAETPFTLTQVTEAYIRLKNLGIEPTEARLRSFGNTSAAMGKDLMQFIEAVADASTGEFERLKEFGIRASKEGDKVRFTFQGVTETVQFNADAISNYLQRLGESKFGDAMAKQAETIDGKLSNLQDTTAAFGRALGQLGISSATMASIEGLTAALKFATEFAERLGRALGKRDLSTRGGLINRGMELRQEIADLRSGKGNLGVPALGEAARKEAELADVNRRLLAQEVRDPSLTDPMSRLFPLNANGRFGAVPQSSSGPAKTPRARNVATKKPQPTWLEQARAGTFFDPGPNGVEAFMARDFASEKQPDIQAMLADLEKVNTQIDLINVKPIQPISPETLEMTRQFAENLTSGLAQAIIYGQDIGKALVNSIKAAAAQLIASKLLNLLGGGLGKIFGGGSGGNIFKRESGGPVKAGQPYLVGEKRPEIFVPNSAGYIQPRVPQGKSGGQDGMVRVSLDQGLVATMVAGAVQVADARGAERMRQSVRTRMPQSPGA